MVTGSSRDERGARGHTLKAVGVVGDDVGALDALDDAGDHLLGHAHLGVKGGSGAYDVEVVGVGHVELAGGELGVVGHINALVSELLAELVDAVKATDDEGLGIEAGRRSVP